jgi:UDP-glucuronate 4-epimerase
MGRPDMAVWKFTESVMHKTPINLYEGNVWKYFIHVQDVIEAMLLAETKQNEGFRVLNVNAGFSHKLTYLIKLIQDEVGDMCPVMMKDVRAEAPFMMDTTALTEMGFVPKITLEEGVKRFVEWYKQFKLK